MRYICLSSSSLNTFWDIPRTKFKNENEQRTVTPKVWSFELCSMCTALLLNEIYLPMKCHVYTMHILKLYFGQKRDGVTDGLTDWLTDGRTDGRVNYYMPPFGGIKIELSETLVLYTTDSLTSTINMLLLLHNFYCISSKKYSMYTHILFT